MKRIVFGIIWFVVISLVGLVGGGAVAGAIVGSKVAASSFSEGYAKGEQVGHAAGAEFGQKYGGLVLLGALVVSIVGTGTGILPGTKRKSSE
jgi:hypothetical protein